MCEYRSPPAHSLQQEQVWLQPPENKWVPKKVTFKTTFKLSPEVKSKEQCLQNIIFA